MAGSACKGHQAVLHSPASRLLSIAAVQDLILVTGSISLVETFPAFYFRIQ